jgi:tetratricopeptide (TPR) repeat protein
MKIKKAIPKKSHAVPLYAQDLLDRGKDIEAINALKKGVRDFPKNSTVLYALGDLYYRMGSFGRAKKIFERGVQTFPQSESFYVRLSAIHVNRREFDKAMSCLLKGRKQCPDGDVILNALDEAFKLPGQFDAAGNVVRYTRKIDPKDTVAMNMIVNVLAENGHIGHAKVMLTDAIIKTPSPANESYIEMHYQVCQKQYAPCGTKLHDVRGCHL